MGRMLYRGKHEVVDYRMLSLVRIESARNPWLSRVETTLELEPDGPNCRLVVEFAAVPGFWVPGRLLLSWTLERRLQGEADALIDRLSKYVERSMPYH
jgi:hypothetical protein